MKKNNNKRFRCVGLDVLDHEPITKQRSGTVVERIASTLTTSHHLSSSFESSNHYENGFDDEDDYDSLQYQFSSYGYQALKFFKQFIQKLNNLTHLQSILSNWVIGNQVIIKYTNRTDDQDFIRAFASVLRVKNVVF